MPSPKTMQKAKFIFFGKVFFAGLIFLSTLCFVGRVKAASEDLLDLSKPFIPPYLNGVTINSENPFELQFLVTPGDEALADDQFKQETYTLIDYFLAAVTTPEEDMWVNLSPVEKDRIAPQHFIVTEMGRDLLAQDYTLKQLSASVLYPMKELGADFWDKVNQQIYAKYGTVDIPVKTFARVWILPDSATVFQENNSVRIIDSKLKVMLEKDLSLPESLKQSVGVKEQDDVSHSDADEISSQVMREIMIPALAEDVNYGKNFARLRQVYRALILATWFKQQQQSLLNTYYTDKKKTGGIDHVSPQVKDQIYQQYVQAFKEGSYHFIKESAVAGSDELVPRKYFAGGISMQETTSRGIIGMSEKIQVRTDLEAQKASSSTINDHSKGGRPIQVNVNLKPVFNVEKGKASFVAISKRQHDVLQWLLNETDLHPETELQVDIADIRKLGFKTSKEMQNFFWKNFEIPLNMSGGGLQFKGFAEVRIPNILKLIGLSATAQEFIIKGLPENPVFRADVIRMIYDLWVNKRTDSKVAIDLTDAGIMYRQLLDIAPQGSDQRLEEAKEKIFGLVREHLTRRNVNVPEKELQEILGTIIQFIGATDSGGGVAEMRPDTVRVMSNLISNAVRWLIIDGAGSYYGITVKVHEALHDPYYAELTDADRLKLQITWITQFERFEFENDVNQEAGQATWIDDPQPAGLIPLLRARYPGMILSWRIHVDTSNPTRSVADYLVDIASGKIDPQRDGLMYSYLSARMGQENLDRAIAQGQLGADVVEFHMIDFARGMFNNPLLSEGAVEKGMAIDIMPPAINPLSDKNRFLLPEEILGIREWLQKEYNIPVDAELVVQISRFDPFKGPVEAMTSFTLAMENLQNTISTMEPGLERERLTKLLRQLHFVYAGNIATDNPKGARMVSSLKEYTRQIPEWIRERIHLVEMPTLNKVVNALQTSANTVVQFSSKEGFGLTASEALFKAPVGRPTGFITTDVGGLNQQVPAGTGWVVSYLPSDQEKSWDMYRSIEENKLPDINELRGRKIVQDFGQAMVASLIMSDEDKLAQAQRAREHVVEHYTTTANVQQILEALIVGFQTREQKDLVSSSLTENNARNLADVGGILLDPNLINLNVQGSLESKNNPANLTSQGLQVWENIVGFAPVIVDARLAPVGSINP